MRLRVVIPVLLLAGAVSGLIALLSSALHSPSASSTTDNSDSTSATLDQLPATSHSNTSRPERLARAAAPIVGNAPGSDAELLDDSAAAGSARQRIDQLETLAKKNDP